MIKLGYRCAIPDQEPVAEQVLLTKHYDRVSLCRPIRLPEWRLLLPFCLQPARTHSFYEAQKTFLHIQV